MAEIDLIPYLNACDFTEEMIDELTGMEISTHYQHDVMSVDWKDKDYLIETKKWLLETYGEDIKGYSSFAISAT